MTDKRSVEFVDRLTQIFEGHGELLGGETKPSRLVPTNLVDDATVGKETPLRRETSQDLPGGCLNSAVRDYPAVLNIDRECAPVPR